MPFTPPPLDSEEKGGGSFAPPPLSSEQFVPPPLESEQKIPKLGEFTPPPPESSEPGWLQDKLVRFGAAVGAGFDKSVEAISRLVGAKDLSSQYADFVAQDEAALRGDAPVPGNLAPNMRANPEMNQTYGSRIAGAAGSAAGMIAPALVSGGIAGVATMTTLGSSAAYTDSRDKALSEGKSEDEANHEGLKSAGIAAAALPLYFGAGKLASSAVQPLMGTLNPAGRFAVGAAAATGANVASSAVIRGTQGEDISPSAESLTQDVIFGGLHGFGEASRPSQVRLAGQEKARIESLYDEGAKKLQNGEVSQDEFNAYVQQVNPIWKGLNSFLDKSENKQILEQQKENNRQNGVAQEVGPATADVVAKENERTQNEQEQTQLTEVGPELEEQPSPASGGQAETQGQESQVADSGRGVGGASPQEFEINRTINGGDIFNAQKNALGEAPTQEQWKRAFEGIYPELSSEEYNTIYDKSRQASEAFDESGGSKPMPDVVSQLIQKSPENSAILSREEQPDASIKNSSVTEQMNSLGLSGAEKAAEKSFGETWDEAARKVQDDPRYTDSLIQELKDDPRPINDVEVAVLLRRQVSLRNQFDAAAERMTKAYDSGDDAEIVQARVALSAISDDLMELRDITKKSGTDTARALSARKILASLDYSLSNMILRKRAANDGRELSPQEISEITKQQKEIQDIDKKLEEHEAVRDEKQASSHFKESFEEIKKEIKKPKSSGEKKDHVLDRLKNNLENGKDLKELSVDVQRLAEDFVREGVKDREALIDAVHGELKKISPEITRRETMDAISGYGNYRPLSKDQIKVQLRDLKGQMQQVAKIDDLEKGIPPVKTGVERRTPTDPERKLITKVNELKRTLGIKTTKSDIQLKSYLDSSKTRVKNRIKDLQDQIAKREKFVKDKKSSPSDPELKNLIEKRGQLQKELDEIVNPKKSPDEQKLALFKTRVKNRIKDLQDRLDKGDFAKRPPKNPLRLDEEGMRLQSERAKLQDKFNEGIVKDTLRRREGWEKTQDTLVKWRRSSILSGPLTLGKLSAAALERIGFSALEEGVGGAISKIIPKVAQKAPREGGLNLRAESRAVTEGFTRGMKDAWETLTTGKSELDSLYGKSNHIPRTAIDYIGSLHGALKAPAKRAEFTRSLDKRMEFSLRNGEDITEPLVQARNSIAAYKDAQRAIFMQNNIVVEAYKRGLSTFYKKDKETGKIKAAHKTASTVLNVTLPIVKVPTNIVSETFVNAAGIATGSIRLARSISRGIDSLSSEEADLILRHLKKGSLGGAVLLIGFLNPRFVQAGGYYQHGEKKKEGDIKFGGVRLMGKDIPRWMVHNPLLEMLQIGATIRNVTDSQISKKNREKMGIGAGVMAAILGVAEEAPFVNELTRISALYGPNEQRNKFIGQYARDLVIPQILGQASRFFDKDANGDTVNRNPNTPLEYLESGIPGLRNQLPEKKHR